MSSDADPPPGRVTELLHLWSGGDPDALDELLSIVYTELRAIARRQLARERGGHLLQPTALINEAYLKLAGQNRAQWMNREQFLAVASQVMRRILVDHARRVRAGKRGGGWKQVTFDENVWGEHNRIDVIELDTALQTLTGLHARQGRIVELRVFAGLTVEETATVLRVSPITVQRDWRLARAWLRRELTG